MTPTNFPESTDVIDKPKEWDYDQCDPLCTASGTLDDGRKVIISCWKFTQDELAEINKTGRLWLYVFGDFMVPVALTGHYPFKN